MIFVYIDLLVEVVLRFICGVNMLFYFEYSVVDIEIYVM